MAKYKEMSRKDTAPEVLKLNQEASTLTSTDGIRTVGEEYLGYKDQPDITEQLRQIFENRNGTQIPSPSSTYSPCVLFLNGFPGVGKLTIARHLRRILSESLLVDNHLLINPAEAIEPNRTPAHYTLRRAIRQAAFDGLKAVERKSTIFIMTSCTADNPADREVFSEFVDIARVRGILFVSIIIDCEPIANMARLTSAERYCGKNKLANGQVLAGLRLHNRLLDPKNCQGETEGVKIYHTSIDTTGCSVTRSTNMVLQFLSSVGS